MFDNASPKAPDSLRRIVGIYASDARDTKLDLLVGVYRDENGKTPIMAAVKMAQSQIASREESKGYIAVAGREGFTSALLELVLVDESVRDRALGLQSVGGDGAVRLLFNLVKHLQPDARVWLSDPGYHGHEAIAFASGLATKRFSYYNRASNVADEERMLAALRIARRGDLIVLDASCQNPTGIDLSSDVWLEVGNLCQSKGLIPLVDVAYQGLANGLDADVAGISMLCRKVDYALIAVSCSKTFGVYRERAGVAVLIGPTRHRISSAIQMLTSIGFETYGVPPDHGAAIVETILRDQTLRASWEAELSEMRQRLIDLRAHVSCALSSAFGSDSFEYIRRGHGLFSLLPLNDSQMRRLREEHAIYGLDSGRVNLACLRQSQIRIVSDAICRVLSKDA